MVEMALAVYLVVFLEAFDDDRVNNPELNLARRLIFLTIIDIPTFVVTGIGFAYLAKYPVDVKLRLLKIMTLFAIICFISWVLDKVATSLGIMLTMSVIGTIILAFKEIGW